MAVDQAGNDAAPLQIDAKRLWVGKRHDVAFAASREESASADCDCFGLRVLAVERGDLGIQQDHIGDCGHQLSLQSPG